MPQLLHRIRLQGPWDALPPGAAAGAPMMPVELPAGWRELFGNVGGQAIFIRRFNTPTGLEPGDQLWIRLPPGCGDIVEVQLNGHAVSQAEESPAGIAFDITLRAERFNELKITLRLEDPSAGQERGGLWQPVWLEIVR